MKYFAETDSDLIIIVKLYLIYEYCKQESAEISTFIYIWL